MSLFPCAHFHVSHLDTRPSCLPASLPIYKYSLTSRAVAARGVDLGLSPSSRAVIYGGLRPALTLHLGPGSINDGRSVAPWMVGRDSFSTSVSLSLSLSSLCPVIISLMETSSSSSSSSPGSINSAGSGDSAGRPWPLMGALISCLISPGTERIDAALHVLPIPLLQRERKDKCSPLSDVHAPRRLAYL